MQLYLIRHGETEWNKKGLCQGHSDPPLNEQGIDQAEKLGEHMHNVHLDAIYASDLIRAVQTAERIAHYHQLSIKKLPALRERYYGEWEGAMLERTFDRYPERRQILKEGGQFGIERADDLQDRVYHGLTTLAGQHLGQTIAVVSHGGAIHAFLNRITNGQLEAAVTLIENSSVTHVSFSEADGWELVAFNRTVHL